MLAETVQEWAAPWVEKGREEGLEKGRVEGLEKGRVEGLEKGRALLCRQVALKFDAAAGRRLAEALADVGDADRLAEVGGWIIECRTPAELFACLAGGAPRNRGARKET